MTAQSIPAAFLKRAKDSPHEIVYRQAVSDDAGGRNYLFGTYATVGSAAARLSHFLILEGVQKGDRVAILSATRPEWLISDLAIQMIGATTVSIYPTVSLSETAYILYDSEVEFVIAENEEQVKKLLKLMQEPVQIQGNEDREGRDSQLIFKKIISVERVEPHPLIVQYESIIDDISLSTEPPVTVQGIDSQDLATLVYTSGTSGPPKGVMQTHQNHLSNVWQVNETGLFEPKEEIFLFLPLAHSFARVIGYIGILTPAVLFFPAIADRRSSSFNAVSILRDLREGGAQVFPAVPRIFQKLLDGVREKGQGSGLKARLLRLTLNAAAAQYAAEKGGKPLSLWSRLIYEGTAGVRAQIKRQLFGSNFRHAVSGGAKLPTEVSEFFQTLNILIYEGYGLTETCVVTNVNQPGKNKVGTVGPLLREVQMRFTEEGEILFRGPNVTNGYFKRPTASAASWDSDGWFHTGDLGRVDEEGFLSIVGRKKELIVTAGGKKIPPAPIEDHLRYSPFISQAVIVGEGQPYCAALITLDEGAVRSTLLARGVSPRKELHLMEEVHELISNEVESVNSLLSQFETIKKFRVLPIDFTMENGLMTPTFKVKRNAVIARFQEEVASMFE